MKEIELRELDFSYLNEEVEMGESEDLVLQGYIATNSPSHILGNDKKGKWREIVAPGVFSKAIENAYESGRSIDFLMNHDLEKILASTSNGSLTLDEDEFGLYFTAKISETSYGKDLYVLVKDGIIKGLSFGMNVIRDAWTFSQDNIPLRTILEIELFEVSALKRPAYIDTYLENRGFELVDTKIPKNIEKRGYGENPAEITPVQIYEGMVLIAEKLDNIFNQLQKNDKEDTIEGLDEAKELLVKAEAVAKLISEQTAAPTNETLPSDPKENEDDNVTRATEAGTEEDPEVNDQTKPSDEEDPKDNPDDKTEETEKVNDDPKAEVDPNDEAAKTEEDKKPEEDPKDDPKPEEDPQDKEKKKKNLELRAWLGALEIMEVPENE